MDATMKHTIGRPTKRIKARARAIKGAIEPSSACMAATGDQSFIRATHSISYTAIAVCQFDVRAPVMPAQTRHRALSHRKVSIINLILSKEGMRAKETVHDNQK